ncbi:hypothetical protein [Dictyobacter arantiisoli]|uniref:hypothetical protein n=1 Tax=Dictyobacter arantiisoli TaxID=2014874 RepID=UPI0011EEAE3B|nr:hypothetical protein [Dictyobacter arantiisoli]
MHDREDRKNSERAFSSYTPTNTASDKENTTMLLEAYLAYALIPLFFILVGILVYLTLRASKRPTSKP